MIRDHSDEPADIEDDEEIVDELGPGSTLREAVEMM